jgi:hypothetical protein
MAGGIILKRIRHDLIASRSLDRALPLRQADRREIDLRRA